MAIQQCAICEKQKVLDVGGLCTDCIKSLDPEMKDLYEALKTVDEAIPGATWRLEVDSVQ